MTAHINPEMSPSEQIVTRALRTSLPRHLSVPAFDLGLTKVLTEYRRHDRSS
jgi:hypothetical protein